MGIVHDNLTVKDLYKYRIKIFSNGDVELRQYDNQLVTKDADFIDYEDPELSNILFSDSSGSSSTAVAFKSVRSDSLYRSRVLCTDLAHENVKDWHSFITLTFADNVSDLNFANNEFHKWVTLWSRCKLGFKYLAVPEFQKRGAVHYHILTNLVCGLDIEKKEPLATSSFKSGRDFSGVRVLEYYNLKYWRNGFSSAFPLELADDKFKVQLYISKYLIKDIDNRLFGRNKIMHSQNLAMPKVVRASDRDDLVSFLIDQLHNLEFDEFRFDSSGAFQVSFSDFKFHLDSDSFSYICKNFIK